ncbi:MAG: hypothetical protein AB8B69_25100, partial [Chitinophagales bacterium]
TLSFQTTGNVKHSLQTIAVKLRSRKMDIMRPKGAKAIAWGIRPTKQKKEMPALKGRKQRGWLNAFALSGLMAYLYLTDRALPCVIAKTLSGLINKTFS